MRREQKRPNEQAQSDKPRRKRVASKAELDNRARFCDDILQWVTIVDPKTLKPIK